MNKYLYNFFGGDYNQYIKKSSLQYLRLTFHTFISNISYFSHFIVLQRRTYLFKPFAVDNGYKKKQKKTLHEELY